MTDWRQRWEEHYQSGHTPWDTRKTPPEVEAFWSSGRLAAQGRALDLGCGPATNVAYLARHGLLTTGVDLASSALALGLQRIREDEPDLLPRVQLVQADVTRLPFFQAGFQYILDIGCFHGLPPDLRTPYSHSVINNLAPGGYYQLYAFDCLAGLIDDPEKAYRGMGEEEVATRFAPQLQVVEIERARPDRYPCRWYLLHKG